MKLLNTKEIIDHISTTILSAKKYIIIISPYIQFDEEIQSLITDCDERNTKIIIVCGKTALYENAHDIIKKWKKCELRFTVNLHAKCILNEEFGILSSMNLYNASKTNFELGCLISKKYDTKAFDKLEMECFSIIQKSEMYRDDLVKK